MKHYLSPEGVVFAYELDGSQDHLIPSNYTPITIEDAQNRSRKLQEDMFNALSYAQKRQSEYPSVGDQLDALFHAGVFPTEMTSVIQSIKDRYPKNV